MDGIEKAFPGRCGFRARTGHRRRAIVDEDDAVGAGARVNEVKHVEVRRRRAARYDEPGESSELAAQDSRVLYSGGGELFRHLRLAAKPLLRRVPAEIRREPRLEQAARQVLEVLRARQERPVQVLFRPPEASVA